MCLRRGHEGFRERSGEYGGITARVRVLGLYFGRRGQVLWASRFHVNDHSKTTEREGGEDRVKGWVGSWVEGNKKYVLICLSLLCDMSIWFPGCVSPSNPQGEIPCDVRKGLWKVIGSQGQSPQEWDLCLKKRPHSAPLILSPGEDTRRL